VVEPKAVRLQGAIQLLLPNVAAAGPRLPPCWLTAAAAAAAVGSQGEAKATACASLLLLLLLLLLGARLLLPSRCCCLCCRQAWEAAVCVYVTAVAAHQLQEIAVHDACVCAAVTACM
jgi:hypothetical protein